MNTKGYDKVTMRKFESAFKRFDRSTALGCKQKKIPYDVEKCKQMWDAYRQVFIEHSIIPPQSPL